MPGEADQPISNPARQTNGPIRRQEWPDEQPLPEDGVDRCEDAEGGGD